MQLENIFAKFGEIEDFRFLRHRGSAFICFHRIDDAIAAQKSMNWKHLGGSEIRVDFQRSPTLRRVLMLLACSAYFFFNFDCTFMLLSPGLIASLYSQYN